MIKSTVRRLAWVSVLAGCALFNAPPSAQAPAPQPPVQGLPSERPAQFKTAIESFDHVRRDVMIPMRDGVKLHTVILVPKGSKSAPILLTHDGR